MGKDNEELSLRQVNMHKSQVSAVSEGLNASSFKLTYMDTAAPGLQVTSPVMKDLGAISAIPAQPPTEQQMSRAYDNAGLKLSSNSHKRAKAVEEAGKRHTRQTTFATTKPRNVVKPNADAFRFFNNLDLSSLMFENERSDSFSPLLDHYKELKEIFLMIPDYETAIRTSLTAPNADQKALEKAQAKLKTLYDLRAYYDVLEDMMSNKYYAFLSMEDTGKLSYKELRTRLDGLYREQNRDTDLIDYYQNLIRLKELGLSDMKSVKNRQHEYTESLKRPPVPQDTRNAREELDKMAKSYKELLSSLSDEDSIAPDGLYTEMLFKTFAPDLAKFRTQVPDSKKSSSVKKLLADYDAYVANVGAHQSADRTQELLRRNKPEDEDVIEKRNASSSGIALTPAQQEGVRRIGAWLIQNGKDHAPFVFNLLQAPPEQQLLVFYLIENKKQDNPQQADYFSALHNYEPDLSAFTKNSDWTMISRAVRASMKMSPEMKRFGALSENIRQTQQRIDAFSNPNPNAGAAPTLAEKKSTVIKGILQRGVLLKKLYAGAGLHEDMPPDMVQDPVLRQRLKDEYLKILELIRLFRQLDPQAGGQMLPPNAYQSPRHMKGTALEDTREEEMPTSEAITEGFELLNEAAFETVSEGSFNLLEAMGETVLSFMETPGYNFASGAMAGIGSISGLVGSLFATYSLYQKTGSLTQADGLARTVDLAGDYLTNIGSLVTGAGELTNVFTNAQSVVSSTWLGSATDALWTTSNIGDKLMVGGGAVAVVAGAVKATSATIQAFREYSNFKDADKAQQTLAAKEAAHQPLTKSEQKLKVFLSHQKLAVKRDALSAGVDIVTGIMTSVAGGLTMSGYLAPIGGIVGLAALGITLVHKGVNYALKREDRINTVDEFLNIDNLVSLVRNDATHPKHAEIQKQSDRSLRKKIRQEALAMLGFDSYKECYRHICTEIAEMLYQKVFLDNPRPADYDMYYNAMSSLGMMIKPPSATNREGKPSVKDMISKMMD